MYPKKGQVRGKIGFLVMKVGSHKSGPTPVRLDGALEGGVAAGDGRVVRRADVQLVVVLQEEGPLAGVQGGALVGLVRPQGRKIW